MLRISAILAFLLILIPPCLAAEFTVLEDVKYVEDDGDSCGSLKKLEDG